MSQVDTATPIKSTPTRKERVEAFLRTFEWTWTTAVVFSLGLVFFLLITTSVVPSFWLYFADSTLKWNDTAPQKLIIFTIDGYWLKELRDAIAMGLSHPADHPRAGGRRDHAELAQEAPRFQRRLASHRRVPVGARMPFSKTEVDIHEDYVVEAVDPAWLSQGVKSPKHLMLDPDNCILCRACEDVCPWNCIYMLSTGIVEGAAEDVVEDEVDNASAIFVVDDIACTRCSVCVDRCPTDTLYYARLPEGSSGKRTMAEVPGSQAVSE